jgi:hypothetical protein
VYRFRPALAVTAALALVTAAAAPAIASTSTAHGTASSGLRLLHVEVGGHAISAGQISAEASNAATPHVAELVITPAALDGTTYGQQKVTPASSPVTVPSGAQTATIPGGLASLTGPTFAVTAKDGTTVLTSAVLKALGSLNVGPLPVSLDATAATLTNTAQVTSSQSSAEKSVVLGNLALPSIADLLDALNVDPLSLVLSLTKANLDKLNALVDGGALTALNDAVDTASAAVGVNAPTTWMATDAAKTQADSAASAADSSAAAANAAFTSGLTTLAGILNPVPLPDGLSTALTPTQYEALSSTVKGDLDTVGTANGIDFATLAQSALDADAAATAAHDLATALSALEDALFALATQVIDAVGADTDPLAAIGSVNVTTKAVASANSPVPVATAKVGSVSVLGVLTPPAALTSTLNNVLAQLSGVLNSVAGISFTAPSIAVGVGQTSRSVSGTTHLASASITGVTITLPKLTLPTSFLNLAVRNAKSMSAKAAALAKVASPKAAIPTTVITSGGTIEVATLSESASYGQGVTGSAGSPGSGSNPGLAGTGASYTLPVVAALLVMAGLAITRRRRTATASIEA